MNFLTFTESILDNGSVDMFVPKSQLLIGGFLGSQKRYGTNFWRVIYIESIKTPLGLSEILKVLYLFYVETSDARYEYKWSMIGAMDFGRPFVNVSLGLKEDVAISQEKNCKSVLNHWTSPWFIERLKIKQTPSEEFFETKFVLVNKVEL